MAILCRQHSLLFTHVPRTGGAFVENVLRGSLSGRRVGTRHGTYRMIDLDSPPDVRVFTVREPVAWYRSYWAHACSSVNSPNAWPIWDDADRHHPTRPLDEHCGTSNFEHFVRNALEHFPSGFLRATYCAYLNGATVALRSEQLAKDLEILLGNVGYENPAVVREQEAVGGGPQKWIAKAKLPSKLERRLREVEDLHDLDIPYL
jgi:hypothetical protein